MKFSKMTMEDVARVAATMTTAEKKAYVKYSITNHDGKLAGFSSISTSVKCNPHCNHRIAADKDGVTPCGFCFADALENVRKSLREKMEKNTAFYTIAELTAADVPFINAAFFRFESFGDLINVTQICNYFEIARNNPHCTFALWTKNPWIIADAIKDGAVKPDNFIIVLSSVLLNKCAADMRDIPDFVDKVFTVYTDESTATAAGVEINCGARSCATCQRCYKHNADGVKVERVNELVKPKSKRARR